MINTDKFWFHLSFWVLFTGAFMVIEAGHKGDYTGAFLNEMMHLPLRLAVVYLNYFILMPRFLLKERVAEYLSYTVISLVVFGFIQRAISYRALDYIYSDIPDAGFWLPYKFLNASVVLGAPLVFLIGLSLVSYYSDLQKKNERLRSEKLRAELDFLRSQVNPHFLFNTLNNLYGLALEHSKKVPKLILKLSDLLSYSLYESDVEKIGLHKEVELLRNFISLELERYGSRVELEFRYDDESEQVGIPPLLLMPLVENAFKHGVREETDSASIEIELRTMDGELFFSVTNSIPGDEGVAGGRDSGLGLKNLRKRLDILYGDDGYRLSTEKTGTHYTAELRLNLE